jgi:hypothetical protein
MRPEVAEGLLFIGTAAGVFAVGILLGLIGRALTGGRQSAPPGGKPGAGA